MENLIIVAVLAAIVGAAVLYIVKQKKKGVRCIGCPSGGCCSAKDGKNTAKPCCCDNCR